MVLVAALCGMVGSVISILLRAGEFEITKGRSKMFLVVTGATSPVVGCVFGAFVASLLIGILQTFMVGADWSLLDLLRALHLEPHAAPALTRVSLTQFAPIMPYVLMVVILIFRPRGLMGARET